MSPIRSRSPDDPSRLPSGQVLTEKWPVLHFGAVPYLKTGTWELHLFGEVEEEVRLRWEDFVGLGTEERVSDIHCVTRWSRFGNRWGGVPVPALLSRVRLKPTARFVMLHAFGGWTTNLSMEDFDRPENLIATHHDGQPLSAEHGGPARAVIPHLYFWKSAKWLRAIEFMPGDRPGFWEQNGYHMRGDPWKEERYGGMTW